jgi:hypothetical protein
MAVGANDDIDDMVYLLRDEFLNVAAHIATKYGAPGVTEKTVVKLLMQHLCEKCIVEKLKLGLYCENEIDRVWRNLHDYAVTLLVERLKNELAAACFPISIHNEADNPTGRYDVLLVVDGKGVQIFNGNRNICLEAKTGLNISLIQTEKYLWNGATVILARFATGDVIVFRAGDWVDFIELALRDRIQKAKRILDGNAILVPGRDCRECPFKECMFNRNNGGKRNLVKPHDLAELFGNFKTNTYKAIESTVEVVMEELNRLLWSGIDPATREASSEEGLR